jgi:hypothetical protein
MPKKTSTFLVKISPKEAIYRNIKFILCPKFANDVDKVAKIKGECEAKLYQYRNLKFHRKLFGIAKNIVCDEFFQLLLDQWQDIRQIFQLQLNLSDKSIQSTRMQYNSDSYSLIYLCKACFLEWEKEPISGNLIVSSISFREMDNIEFETFYQKCISLWAYILNCPINELDLNYEE